MKKQTKGQEHLGFNKCPSVSNVSFALQPLARSKKCPFTAAPVSREVAWPPHNTGSWEWERESKYIKEGRCSGGLDGSVESSIPSSVAGGERWIFDLAQNVSRVECNAGGNFTLANRLRWFNRTDFAGEPPFHMASYSDLQSINR